MGDSIDDKVSHALQRLHDSVERLPDKHKAAKDKAQLVMAGLGHRSGIRR